MLLVPLLFNSRHNSGYVFKTNNTSQSVQHSFDISRMFRVFLTKHKSLSTWKNRSFICKSLTHFDHKVTRLSKEKRCYNGSVALLFTSDVSTRSKSRSPCNFYDVTRYKFSKQIKTIRHVHKKRRT